MFSHSGYVEISLPHEFRNRVCPSMERKILKAKASDFLIFFFVFVSFQVCGLCGNYNGNATDDLVIKNTGAVTDEVVDFAQSWLVSRKADAAKCLMQDTDMLGSEAVARPRTARSIPCPNHSPNKGLRVLRACQIFKSTATRACRKLVDAEPYYRYWKTSKTYRNRIRSTTKSNCKFF